MGATHNKQLHIFLGNQPRLLREMLELALSQMLEDAQIQKIDAKTLSGVDVSALKLTEHATDKNRAGRNHNHSSNGSGQSKSSGIPWIVLTAPENMSQSPADDKGPDEQAVALLTQHPQLHLAMLGYDARTLQIYAPGEKGEVSHKVYTDFSLAQFVELFESAA